MWKYEYREVVLTWPEWAEICNALGAEGWRFKFIRPDSDQVLLGCFERILDKSALAARAFALDEHALAARGR